MMRPFARQAEFAYFAARLGWTAEEYRASTPVELAFLRKEIERCTVDSSSIQEAAVEVAIANSRRRKRKRFKLWTKRSDKRQKSAQRIPRAEIEALARLMSERSASRREV